MSSHKFGSVEYMHPSLFKSSGRAVYGKSNDYWALGIMLHLLVLDSHPFRHCIDTKQFSRIQGYESSQHHYHSELVQ